jgi:hypothetical protein
MRLKKELEKGVVKTKKKSFDAKDKNMSWMSRIGTQMAIFSRNDWNNQKTRRSWMSRRVSMLINSPQKAPQLSMTNGDSDSKMR